MDLSRYRTLFLEEARRVIMNGELLLGREGALGEHAAELFRCFHTLKGMSATMNHPRVTLLAHTLEDVCDGLVKRTLPADEQASALLSEGFDTLRRQLGAIEDGQEPPAAAEQEERLREYLRAGGNTGFTLLVSPGEDEPPPPRAEEAPAGLRMANAVAAVAEMMSACGRLREMVGPDAAVHDQVRRIEDATRLVYRELVELRQVRFGTVVPALRRHLRAVAARHRRLARLEVSGEEILVDQAVLGALQTALVHLLQNAVIHGIEEPDERLEAGKPRVGRLALHAERVGRALVLAFADDGCGLDAPRLRAAAEEPEGDPVDLAFRAGVSTAGVVDHLAGRGLGLAVVRSVVEGLGGRLAVTSMAGEGTRFRIEVPLHADLVKLLLVEAGGGTWALFDRDVDTDAPADLPARPLLPGSPEGDARVVLRDGDVVRVHRVLGSTEALVSPPPFPLNRLPHVKGTTVAADGRILFVLDP